MRVANAPLWQCNETLCTNKLPLTWMDFYWSQQRAWAKRHRLFGVTRWSCKETKCACEPTLRLFLGQHRAGALHVCLQELRGCDQTGLLCWRQPWCLGFGTWGGTAANARQVLGGKEGEELIAYVGRVKVLLVDTKIILIQDATWLGMLTINWLLTNCQLRI